MFMFIYVCDTDKFDFMHNIQVFYNQLKANIKKKISRVQCPFPVEFAADCIELELPTEPPPGWKLNCTSHPAVRSKMKSPMPLFNQGRLVSCRLDKCQFFYTCRSSEVL